jgi:multidrug efflux pump subunit AcrB
VLVSLFVSFSLDPMLSAVWADPEVTGQRSWVSRKLAFFDRALEWMTAKYRRIVRWALGHRKSTALIAVLAFVGALALPAVGAVGSAFFPDTDESEFQLTVETPPGSSLPYTRSKVLEVAALANQQPEVAHTYATVGGETGAVDAGAVYIRLHPKADRETSQQEVMQRLRLQTARIGGVTPWLKTAHLAETFNVPVCPHFLMELHVALCCAVPNARWVEYIPQLDDLTTVRMTIVDGHALPSQEPGLGIAWDHAAIERLSVEGTVRTIGKDA